MSEGKSFLICAALAAGLCSTFAALPASGQIIYQPVKLGDFGPTSRGMNEVDPKVINSSGLVGGSAQYPPGGFNYLGATLWPAGGTTPVHLDDLGPAPGGVAINQVFALNDSGLAGGTVQLSDINNNTLGYRAVLWPAGGTAAVQLGVLSTDGGGFAQANVGGIDAAGNAFGQSTKFVAGAANLPSFPVKWAAGQTTPVELPNLGADPTGYTGGSAGEVNSSGVIAGVVAKYDNGVNKGFRAVRWLNNGATIQELPVLETDANGFSQASSGAINNAGVAVGWALTEVDSPTLHFKPVQWSADGTQITELGLLTPAGSDRTDGQVLGINNLGDRVGFLTYYSGNQAIGGDPVLWPAGSNTPISINSLIDPNSGFKFLTANAINDLGEIVGQATYDPDGAGPLPAQVGAFRLEPVPEPVGVGVVGLVGILLLRRRR